MRKHAAHPAPALAVLLELERGFHHRANFAGETFRFFLWPEHLTVQARQLRLVIERVHRARPAVHEKLDDPSRLGGMMQAAQRQACGPSLCNEQLSQGQTAKPSPKFFQKFPAVKHNQFTNRNSLLLNNKRHTAANPCSSASFA